MRALQVVRSAWRCTIEEQDDPAVWIAHALKGAGAGLGVLLRGNAVGYAVEGLDASGLSFGGTEQRHPPRLDADVAALAAKGVEVFAVEEDARERGLDPAHFVADVQPITRDRVPALFAEYDQVWHW